MDGVNYLVPVDARLERDVDVRFETVTVDGLLVSTTGGEAAANLGSAVRWRTGQVCLAPAAKEGWQRYGGHDVPRPRTILALALCLLTAPAVDLRAQLARWIADGWPRAGSAARRRQHHRRAGGGYDALTGRPRIRVSRTDTPPEIDGRLDDEVWRTAAMLSEFVQQSPLDGAPATEDTEIYIAYDSDHIYFAFYLHYADPSIMRASRVDRDTAWQDDLMTVYLDTFMDQQVCYDFDLNGYHVQGDGIISANQAEGGAIPLADRSWEALFHSGTQIVEDGYTAEMAIPFKSFRYRPAAGGGGGNRPPHAGQLSAKSVVVLGKVSGSIQAFSTSAATSPDARSMERLMRRSEVEGLGEIGRTRWGDLCVGVSPRCLRVRG